MGSAPAPYDPQEGCPVCGAESGAEGTSLVSHPNGGQPGAACEQLVRLGEHFCRRCRACGHRWVNAPATANRRQ